jgi:hypothetical protein
VQPASPPEISPPPAPKQVGGHRVLFGQRRAGPQFQTVNSTAPDYIRGRTLKEVADDLTSDPPRLTPDQIRIEVFEWKGKLVSLNSRGLAALSKAGFRPTNIVRRAPTPAEEARMQESPILPGGELPSTSIPITLGPNNLEVIEIITIPE